MVPAMKATVPAKEILNKNPDVCVVVVVEAKAGVAALNVSCLCCSCG